MALLVNKTVRLSEEQIAALKEEAKLDKRDVGALIRIAVDDLIVSRKASRAPEPVGAGARNGYGAGGEE